MAEDCTEVVDERKQYKLRAGAPMPTQNIGQLKLHTFMAEQTTVFNYLYIKTLPRSSQFRGQSGEYVSASFHRLEDIKGDVFAGKIVQEPVFVQEDDYSF